ncbi:hypothetical protein Tco_1006332 [Tanacetum coccineum]|uniref:Uncharacterized protein n=1 Tax=Tanacetum coccineum TaxID=301880 RepID=A0ABQ5FIB1_9ASTR
MKEPESTSAPREKTTTTAGKTTTGSKTHKQSASQSALVEETMQSTDVFEAPAHQEFETCVHDEQPEEEVHPLPVWFQQPKRLPSPDRAWNKSVPADHESVQPWLSNLARRQDPRESFDELTDTTFDFSLCWMNRESARDVYSKRRIIAVTKVEIVEWQNYKHLDWITVRRDDDFFISSKEETKKVLSSQRRVEDPSWVFTCLSRNSTSPKPTRTDQFKKNAYTPYSDPEDSSMRTKVKKNRLMRI